MSDPASNHDSHPGLAALSPTVQHNAPADALVAQALACLPPFQSWAHQPTPAAIEQVILDLDEQQLMTTAAVCLMRLVHLQNQDEAA